MDKVLIKTLVLLLAAMLVLTACSTPVEDAAAEPVVDSAPEELGAETIGAETTGEDSVVDTASLIDTQNPEVAAQLVVLTYALEGTDLAVTPAQAQQLVPLWKAVRALNDSDTAAAEELYAVYGQIASAMTAEQLAQLDAAFTGQEDVQALMLALGIQPISANGTGDGTGTGPGAGGGPGSGGGMGGGPGTEGSGLTPEQQATLQAERQASGGRGIGQVQNLLDPLIELLETRAAEQPA